MNGMRHLLPMVALLAAFAACGQNESAKTSSAPAEAPAAPAWVTDLAATANAVEAQPAAADSILQARGMTRAKFDSLIYAVAADSTLSAEYQKARGK
ncbi:MAG: hypothetical protein P8174_08830 [Gemmatimonadota bacterium]